MPLDDRHTESPSGIRPLDTSTGYFPFFLYVLACLIIAIFLEPILWDVPRSWGMATPVGLALGVLPVLFILAGAWERDLPRSIFIAAVLMTIGYGLGLFSPVLATLPSDWKPLQIWRSLLQPSTYAFNFPLLILSGALPLIALRSYFGVYLSRHPSRPKPVLGVEHLMLWTTIAACLLYYLRVPMQQLRLTITNVLVFLPGQLCIAAGTTATLVLPTLRLAFQERPNRWRWPVIVGAILVCSSLLSLLVNVALSGWLKFGNFTFEQSRVFVCLVTFFYTLGLWTLRASGLRWRHYSPPQDSPETARLAKADRMSGRLWTLAYVAVALITTAVSWHFKEARYSTIAALAALRQEYLKRGEDIAISEAAVLSLRLNSLQPNKLPDSFLKNGQRLILRNSDISDDDLAHLSKIQSEFFYHLDLSHTQCTDKAFEHISKLKKLDSLDLSGTRITARGLSEFLKQNQRVVTVILEQMSLDDQQFKQIYNPNVRCWLLAGNQLTDESLNLVWSNPELYRLDASRNPVTNAIFTPRTGGKFFHLVANDCPLDDATLKKLIQSGSISTLELGKSQVTAAGLDFALRNSCDVVLLPGSFTDEELGFIDPHARSLYFRGPKITCNFLTRWSQVPAVLDVSNTLISDDVLLSLAQRKSQIKWLRLRGCPITDKVIPALNAIQPNDIDIRKTEITFEGLKKLNGSNMTVTIQHDQFTIEQLRILEKRFFQVIIATDQVNHP